MALLTGGSFQVAAVALTGPELASRAARAFWPAQAGRTPRGSGAPRQVSAQRPSDLVRAGARDGAGTRRAQRAGPGAGRGHQERLAVRPGCRASCRATWGSLGPAGQPTEPAAAAAEPPAQECPVAAAGFEGLVADWTALAEQPTANVVMVRTVLRFNLDLAPGHH